MPRYTAYGLVVESDLELAAPRCVHVASTPDVTVQVESARALPRRPRPDTAIVRATPAEICLAYEDVGTFRIRHGREIIVTPVPAADRAALSRYVTGSAVGTLLHQRALLVLHASAVTIQNEAVLFLGDVGWGKSTTAAAFCAHEAGVVADDVVALDVDAGKISVLPGFPYLKLHADAAARFRHTLGPMLDATGRAGKCLVPVQRNVPTDSLALSSIFVLADCDNLRIERLRPQEALLALIRHTYVTALLERTGAGARHLRQCSLVVAQVPVYRLERPRTPTVLPTLVSRVRTTLAKGE